MAAAKTEEARFTVTVVPALATLGAHQISTVEPPLAVLVPCDARVHTAPLCVTLLTWLPLFPRVEITATMAFPLFGTGTVTLNEVAAAEPTEPTDVLRRATFAVEAAVEIGSLPTSSAAITAVPLNVRLPASILFETTRFVAATSVVPSYTRVPVNTTGRAVMLAVNPAGWTSV